MNIIKQILIRDLERINIEEQRDGKPRFNSQFLSNHPYLCLAMLISYLFLATLIWYAPYFGLFSLLGFTILFIVMATVLLFEIRPVYRFDDIGVLDLRVCYNGEWFVSEKISDYALEEILFHPHVPLTMKDEIKHIMKLKGEIHFYDVYIVAFSEQSDKATPLTIMNKKTQFQ
ncbi:Inner membrane protein YlaC [Photorhabdus australis subsp. thailandensis]|uniref:Inner membrane protein YlaC n=1 Tax=Photorhabdus australis subsp. thailandensis TaxID=2805096 RepID=A0A1C0U713_9GAMM|nr:YlaC family protein [Photorhabdus australis]OCQ53707.1 Inner membrane protein YlaC [Photorhabdus australis subsp. thailandensis]